MPTMDEDFRQIGLDVTARDVLDDEELERYCRKEGGKPWGNAYPGGEPKGHEDIVTIDPWGLAGSA